MSVETGIAGNEAWLQAKSDFYDYAEAVDAAFDERSEAFKVARGTVGSRLEPAYWAVAELALRKIIGQR